MSPSSSGLRRLALSVLAVWGTVGFSTAAFAAAPPTTPPPRVLNQTIPTRQSTPQEWVVDRTATSQTQELANGTFQTTTWATPHFWQEPDKSWHTLHLNWQAQPNGTWTTPAQPFQLALNPKASGGPTVTWQEGTHQVALHYTGQTPAPVAAQQNRVSLPAVASGVAMAVRSVAHGVAEDLTLQAAPLAPITETVTLTDLVPGTATASGAIPLNDPKTHQAVAWIPAPVVTDAQGATLPDAATQTLTAASAPGQYTWTLTPNPSVFAQAAYPVTVDPSVTITPNSGHYGSLGSVGPAV